MSILLDSLRKSEAQRKIKDAPSIHSAQPYAGAASAPARWPAIAMIGLVAVAITWFGLRQYAGTGEKADASQETVSAQVETPSDVRPGDDVAQQAPASDGSEARTPVERLAQPDEGAVAVPEEEASSEPGDLTPADRIAGFTAPEDLPADTPQDAQEALRPVPEDVPDRDDTAEQSLDDGAVEALARVRRGEPVRAEPEEPEVMSYWQLPQSWRSDMPEFRITVLVYAEDPEERFVLLNGERFREGDEIEGGVVLEEIRRGGAVFSYRSRQFMVKS